MVKTALVTGATTGIGFETASALAAEGYHVLLHGRNEEKALAAAATIGGGKVTPVFADLSDQAAIRSLAVRVKAEVESLDVLVNNAGVWNSQREMTRDGVEHTFAVNHLAYYLLTGLLLDRLRPDGRIICVSSDSHRQVKGIDFSDVSLERHYHGLRSYAQSKLANVLYCYEYDRRKSDGTTICAVQPGLVQTDIGLKGNTWLHRLAWRVRRRMSGNKTPAEGADTSVFLATVADQPPSGLYWDERVPKKSFSSSYDAEEARKLWTLSEQLTGFTYDFRV
ncbi:NAD(P)-dependent dehydrogenase (short-subunit alcohol dehydrogenase family) [Neolewinella xylanilytica]|uniref:NAD(P)-dependent dehydrogenase (Short-subunit alcohol dehydrogenase family) n=1 Tax=Neolewinella xylanilytica TaxID=1514080 RepID=A0A2S6HZY1_9BACT|nr:SDR family NAD(P)-dependent oxidoreductase [Neolewinella xylanilytica]PPK84067.1 NAD(P)-dependent dehydrogenase (short-subunit alcohol dehydrogenase family) [Neolewinella xylanilytica]